MKVNILTPIHLGGPYIWGDSLVSLLNKKGYDTRQINTYSGLLISTIFSRADIIHSGDIPLPFKLWKKPFVFTLHGDYRIQKNMWQRFYPKTLKKADVITTPSKFLKESIGLDKAIIIPNAIFPNEYKKVKHKDKNEIILTTITKFGFKDKAKGIINIIKILEKLQKSTDKKIKYNVIGFGKYLNFVRNFPTKINVNYLGFVKDPREVLEKSDIFLYYSLHDSFAIVLLEAMASGLPVITNDYGPFKEIIDNKNNGFIAKDDKDYLNNIHKLLDYKQRIKIGEKARKKIEEKFDWNKVVNEYIKIYKSLIP